MSRKTENTGFVCQQCGETVLPITNGSYRNHCPFCLYSLHLDEIPGDRASSCKGLMKPVEVDYKAKKGWQIIHLCLQCGAKQSCRIATDTEQSDDYKILATLS